MFDCLSRTFPLHCLDVWRDIYTTLGVYPRILAVPAEDLVQIREMDAHASFIAAARRMLASDGLRRASPATRHAEGRAYEIWCVSQRLARRLPRCNFDESTSFVSFVEGVLRQASFALEEHLGEEPAIPLQSSARASPGNAVFYLDVENSALKGTDGRVIALDERVLRVLVALAGELAGPGRRQPLGKLSDGAVASLYSGERHEWEPDEAAKITYQFTRLLRRSLSRANVGERDATVRRLREKGIAMGMRWAHPAVRGRSEVGLLFGRHRDIVAADR